MDHTAGLRSWQWIFILEGTATFIVGMLNPIEPLSNPSSILLTFFFVRLRCILLFT